MTSFEFLQPSCRSFEVAICGICVKLAVKVFRFFLKKGTRNWSARCSLLNKPGIQGVIELFIMGNFQRFSLSPSLVSKLSANFMIFSLFLGISEICCLLTPYSADKLVPFSNRKIIDCLSAIERTDRLRFKDMMIGNNYL